MKKKSNIKVDPKWGKFLRAPNIYFDKIENNGALVRLMKIADDVKLGVTTGNNDFFYLREETIKEWKLESSFLYPLLKGPRDITEYELGLDRGSQEYCLIVNKSKDELKGTNVLKYIKSGEESAVNLGHYFSNRTSENWYIVTPEHADIVMPYQPNLRHFASIVPRSLVIDKQLVCITTKSRQNKYILAAYLNSTISMLLKEVLSRSSFGLGSIQTSVTDVQNLPVIDPRKMDPEVRDSLIEQFDALKKERIQDIFKELGAKEPFSFEFEKVKKVRRELDKVVFEVLGLTEDESKEVYRSVLQLASERIIKSKNKGKKAKSYVPNATEIANQIFSDIEDELLVKFPEDFIEAIDDFEEIRVPGGMGSLESNLEGLFVKIGSEVLPVDSKTEGEFLKYSAMFGERKIKVPRNESQQRAIIKKFEPTYRKLIEHIDSALEIYSTSESLKLQIEFEIFRNFRKPSG